MKKLKISDIKNNKNRLYCLLIILLVAALVIQLFFTGRYLLTSAAAPVTDWGLSYQKAGETPVGNASAEYLANFDAYYAGSSTEKVLYLTFDAGYENGYTEKILDVLKMQEVKAIFF
jgi:peptidoglycan-N-acetylmuramic acid deacetylase